MKGLICETDIFFWLADDGICQRLTAQGNIRMTG